MDVDRSDLVDGEAEDLVVGRGSVEVDVGPDDVTVERHTIEQVTLRICRPPR